ncbi:MAG: sensor histidine kinase [Terracidiphilus sp.]|jgi:signal transduction histidine kinase
MQQTEQTAEFNNNGLVETGLVETGQTAVSLAGASVTERERVVAVVETLANLHSRGESLAEVAHDARNMVTALGLYCDLLDEPGVLSPSFHHYSSELRLVATASRRLVEKLLTLDARLDARMAPDVASTGTGLFSDLGATRTRTEAHSARRLEQARRWDLMPPEPIKNLAEELVANRNMLSALAGPSITLTVEVESGALPVRLTGEDLTRILINLVKNAAEAMPAAGRIAINLHEFHAGGKHLPWLLLTIEDNGPGIPVEALEKIFDSGYTTRQSGTFGPGASASGGPGNWPTSHRGLGLPITRSIVEAAGGNIHASNSAPGGACFKIELPTRSL